MDRYMPLEGITKAEQVFDMFMSCLEKTAHESDSAAVRILKSFKSL